MPGVDWIPGVAHLKAACQAITGDTKGAGQTLVNFSRECPVVSQVTSLVQLAAGDTEGALETQKICLGTVNNVANGIPVVGHVKGAIHHIAGDPDGGNQALNAASRSTVVIGSGAAAAIATGGIGAIPAGIAAGVAYDTGASIVTDEPQGILAAVERAVDEGSAGAIFDAVAIPVGDGLAGYSGGKIGKQIKINRLEVARAAKLEQLDAAMFDPVEKGGGNGALAYKLGNEIKNINQNIDVLKHGQPTYGLKPETPLQPKASPRVVPIPGVRQDVPPKKENKHINEEKPSPTPVPSICCVEHDALYHDSYVDAQTTEYNKAEKQKKLDKKDKKRPEGHIHDKYKHVKHTTVSIIRQLLELISKDPEKNPERNPHNNKKDAVCQLLLNWWLLLIMPKEFAYTLLGQLNSATQGFYHSFIRHIGEWQDVIRFDNALMARLSPLIPQINRLASGRNENEARIAREEFVAARRQINAEDFDLAMVEIQETMHRFIQRNITLDNFLGRTVNANGSEQLMFKVKTLDGRYVVMVICVSNEKYEPVNGDNRPIRVIITAFFKPWKDYLRQGLAETKDEMQSKRKL